MRDSESQRGGNPRAILGQPRRSYSPAARYRGGGGGFGVQPGWQKMDCGEV